MHVMLVVQQTKGEVGCAFNLGVVLFCLRLAHYCGFDLRISDRDYFLNGHVQEAKASRTDGKGQLEDFQTEFSGELGEEGELGEKLLDFDAMCNRIDGIFCHGDVCACLVYGGEKVQWSWAMLCRES